MHSTFPSLLPLLICACLITEDDHQAWLDQDGDGVLRDVDCDDTDAEVGAGNSWYVDDDGDGFALGGADQVRSCLQPSGYTDELGDCDDGDPLAYPGADETWYDGIDGDCDGADDYDQDGDGWLAEDWGDDCDDTDAAVNPAAYELVDGIDNNCDDDVDFLELAQADALLVGEYDGDCAGISVAGVGDVDGDGFDDLLIGTEQADDGAVPGKAHLVMGPVSGELELRTEAYLIEGSLAGDEAGSKVSSAGDTDGDGLFDFLVGAPEAGDSSAYRPGEAYLFLGQSSFLGMDVDAAALVVQGVNDGDQLGYEMVGGGDLDGDGLDDLAVTAVGYADVRGKVYVALGASEHRGIVGADSLDAGFTGVAARDRHGRGLAMGDMNGDGLDELISGAKEHDGGGDRAGAAFILDFQGTVESRDMADADGLLLGAVAGGLAGGAVAVGDLDDDGYGELIVSAEVTEVDGFETSGTVYLAPGGAVLPSGSLASMTTRMDGDPGCRLGRSLAILGDVDGDGTQDLAIGGPECTVGGTDAGAVMILLGGFEGSLRVSDADIILAGGSGARRAGWSVAAAGDVDASGFEDILVGSPDDGGGPGVAHLFTGREF